MQRLHSNDSGFAAAFASDLRARGIEAWALSQENQLELPF